MKITASQLRSIIREEVQKTLTSRRRALRETDEFDYADEPYLWTFGVMQSEDPGLMKKVKRTLNSLNQKYGIKARIGAGMDPSAGDVEPELHVEIEGLLPPDTFEKVHAALEALGGTLVTTPENSGASLEDYISHAVQDIKAGTHPVTGDPLSANGTGITVDELAEIADGLAEGYGDGELDLKEILQLLLEGLGVFESIT